MLKKDGIKYFVRKYLSRERLIDLSDLINLRGKVTYLHCERSFLERLGLLFQREVAFDRREQRQFHPSLHLALVLNQLIRMKQ